MIDEGGIGGQARSSSLIRNYLGFPSGVSGGTLDAARLLALSSTTGTGSALNLGSGRVASVTGGTLTTGTAAAVSLAGGATLTTTGDLFYVTGGAAIAGIGSSTTTVTNGPGISLPAGSFTLANGGSGTRSGSMSW